jgi:hypothetical protein
VIIPASERFTLSTSDTCSAIERLRWTTPIPPSRASAIAIGASVTVSIAAEMTGISSSIARVKRVRVETSFGRTADSAGTSRTSSNVRPSFANFASSASKRSTSTRPSSSSAKEPAYQGLLTAPGAPLARWDRRRCGREAAAFRGLRVADPHSRIRDVRS